MTLFAAQTEELMQTIQKAGVLRAMFLFNSDL
jgi:hypothetical protein